MLRLNTPSQAGFYLFLVQNIAGVALVCELSCMLVYLLHYVFSFDEAPPWETVFSTEARIATPGYYVILIASLSFATMFIYGRAFLRGLYDKLLYHGIFDHPNERSMHFSEIPRGGGWLVVVTVSGFALFLMIWLLAMHYVADPQQLFVHTMFFLKVNFRDYLEIPVLTIAGGALLVAIISWIDDLIGLGAAYRLIVHSAAVAIGLSVMPVLPACLPFLHPLLAYVFFGVLWLGFMNIYNFMDGIDGITASQTITVMGNQLLIYFIIITLAPLGYSMRPQLYPDVWLLGAITGSCLAFLSYNWHPARIFLGDVGSIPLGYVAGYSLLSMVQQGYWYIALTLPLYYLADGGLTLLRRIVLGEKFWLPHRTHFYQRATLAAGRHDVVVMRIILCNLLLGGIAALGVAFSPWYCLAAPLPVILLLQRMAYWQSNRRWTKI